MNTLNDIENKFPSKEENPFSTPGGYFDSFSARMMEKIKTEETKNTVPEINTKGRSISLRPFISLAAVISGIALVTYFLLQSVVSDKFTDEEYFDLATVEEVGIINDEYNIAESYESNFTEENSDWDEDAMDYLASNEVNLELLLASN